MEMRGIRKEWNDGIASETNMFVKTSVSPGLQGVLQQSCAQRSCANPLKRKNGLESPFVVEMRGFVLAFRKTKMLVYAYATQSTSVLLAHNHFAMQQVAVLRTMWAHRPLHTDNSNDKRLIVLCFVVIATNNSLDCLLDAFVRIPSTLYIQQNKKAGKSHLPVFLWWSADKHNRTTINLKINVLNSFVSCKIINP